MNIPYLKKTTESWSVNVLLFSVFFILAGLLIVPRTSNYHTIYYISSIVPILLILIVNPKVIFNNISITLKIFIIFAAWSILSTLWSDTDESIMTPIKRAIYIFCLFLSFAIVQSKNNKNLLKVFILAGSVVTIVASYDLYLFQTASELGNRFIGPGALKNSLLSSLIFGFFSVLFFSLTLFCKNLKANTIFLIAGLLLILLVLATGSRTPLLALTAAAIWIIFTLKNRISFYIIILYAIALALILIFYPEAILSRGLSYRPELWSSAIDKILLKPFIGYGFESSLEFYVSSLNKYFKEPHNTHLSIFYFTGLLGFILWCSMHMYALWSCWKNKQDQLFIIAGALLVYGIMAGMTDGGSLLSRPKEHWFITWIPLAFISALIFKKQKSIKNTDNYSLKN